MKRIPTKEQIDVIQMELEYHFRNAIIGHFISNAFREELCKVHEKRTEDLGEIKERFLSSKLTKFLYKKGWIKLQEMENYIKGTHDRYEPEIDILRRKYMCSDGGWYFGKDVDFATIKKEIDEIILDGTDRPLSLILAELKSKIDQQRSTIIKEMGLESLFNEISDS